MPTYYLHLTNEHDRVIAKAIERCANADLAREVALGSAVNVMAEDLKRGHEDVWFRMRLHDQQGSRLAEITLSAQTRTVKKQQD